MGAAVAAVVVYGFRTVRGWPFVGGQAHWVAGLVLTAAVVFHIGRSGVWLDFRSMLVGVADLRSGWQVVKQTGGQGGAGPIRIGKYSLLQKLFHLVGAVDVLSLVVTGLLMLAQID